jgi:hypothetical protein
VVCVEWNRETEKERGGGEKTIMEGDNLTRWRLFDDNPHSFKSYIVRCGIYTNVKRYILSGVAPSLASLVDISLASLVDEYRKMGENQVSSSS